MEEASEDPVVPVPPTTTEERAALGMEGLEEEEDRVYRSAVVVVQAETGPMLLNAMEATGQMEALEVVAEVVVGATVWTTTHRRQALGEAEEAGGRLRAYLRSRTRSSLSNG